MLQIRWTKAGATDHLNDLYLNNETLRIDNISRHQGGRYYCKAENRHGVPAIRSIRVEVYCKSTGALCWCPHACFSPAACDKSQMVDI